MSITNLNETIIHILNTELRKFIVNGDENICYELIIKLKLNDFYHDVLIQNTFNSDENPIFEYNFKTFNKTDTLLEMIIFIKQELIDNYGMEDNFINLFQPKDCFINILSNYTYHYANSINCEEFLDLNLMRYYKNIYRTERNNKKHNKLIKFYNKLERKNKQKKTITKILNKKFNQDITESILIHY